MREKIAHFIRTPFFHHTILVVIIINAVVIGLKTSAGIEARFGDVMDFINLICLAIFIVESVLRIYVHRFKFFRRGWDMFDLLIVLLSLLPESHVISTFRFFRVFRVLRMITIIPKIQLITQVLLRTLSSVFSIGLLLMIVFYVYAVITTTLYGKDFPEWFGTIGDSFYTLFQIMTFESWSMSITRPIMELHPYAWVVFISFLIVATYIMLNIVIGIIVDSIGDIKAGKLQAEDDEDEDEVVLALSTQIKELKQQLDEIQTLLKAK